MLASEVCHVPELGEAYFYEKGMTNIIGFRKMRRR